MISLVDVNVIFAKNSPLEMQALNNLNCDIQDGEFITIIGGNGAGKSTVLNLLSGSIIADSGNIIMDGKDITNTSQYFRAKFFSKVMQNPQLGTISSMTIMENMSFALRRGLSRHLVFYSSKSRKKLFQYKLSMLGMGLEDRLDSYVTTLSGGQRQGLSLIMSIMRHSNMLLLDEFTAALDPKIADHVMYLADRIVRKEKLQCVMITHNMSHALQYGDRLLLLQDGCFKKEFDSKTRTSLLPADLAAEFG